jgi:hypothetical protein
MLQLTAFSQGQDKGMLYTTLVFARLLFYLHTQGEESLSFFE